MDVEFIYSEEVAAQLKTLKKVLKEYETQLQKLIDKTPNLGHRDREAFFYEDHGRAKILKQIHYVKVNAIPEKIQIINFDKLRG